MFTPRSCGSVMFISLALALAGFPAFALQGYSTCHATGTTAIDISGMDTTNAKMVSAATVPDALESCQRNEGLKGKPARECAEREMSRQGLSVVKVYANCSKGTIAVEYQPVPASAYYTGPGRTHTDRYKLPLAPTCGDDNLAAINAFKTVCPSYEGKIEESN